MLHERHPLVGRKVSPGGSPKIAIHPSVDSARFVLRVDPVFMTEAGKAFGAPLASSIGLSLSAAGLTSVCLGPDEWYLLAPAEDIDRIEGAFAGLATDVPHAIADIPHSLVDVSHREVGIDVTGESAALALRSAIAFDVQSMKPGQGCRTIFDKAQVILIRESEDHFRIEVWRSFASHVWGILAAAAREIELDI